MSDSLSEKPGCLAFFQKWFGALGGDGANQSWPYDKKKYLLSRAEFSFYRVLQQACGDRFVICPKIRLADLIYVKKGTESRQSFHNKIDRKHIDFVLCDAQTMVPVAAVELDDKSHQSESAQKRDADKDKACQAAGLLLLRFPARKSYDLNAIKARLANLNA